jgi:hypothetical protein
LSGLLDSDFTSDITNVIADQQIPSSYRPEFEEGLDFILKHFEEPIFPRTISTKTTQGRQIAINNRAEALARFSQANGLDCRIAAYPVYTDYYIKNTGISPDFLFIDLDAGQFDGSKARLDRCLNKTLNNIRTKFNDRHIIQPTIIWSGHGYHIYLPVEAFVLEEETEFNRFGYPSRKFIQFAEYYLSDNKADPCHTKGLSFKNCMIRIPGSINSKSGLEEVKIIQRWNGYRPNIKPLLFRFDLYLLVSKSKELHKHNNNNKQKSYEPRVFSTDWRKT